MRVDRDEKRRLLGRESTDRGVAPSFSLLRPDSPRPITRIGTVGDRYTEISPEDRVIRK